jgi:predicted peptidase
MNKTICTLTGWLCLTLLAVSCQKSNDSNDLPTTIETQPAILKPVTQDIGNKIGGYYEALPAGYSQTQGKYPLLIFLPGAGQYGSGSSTDLAKVLTDGTPLLLKQQKFPPDFLVNGQHFSFIVLVPQFKSEPLYADLQSFVDYAFTKYRANKSYFYLTGFSLGARQSAEFGVLQPMTPAAIVTMAGAYTYNLPTTVKGIADNKLPVWCFHNEQDQVLPSKETKDFVAAINSYNPAIPARQTIFPTSDAVLKHDCWTKVSDPAYKENGLNIYEWMLSYKR